MDSSQKIAVFDYVVHQITVWYSEATNSDWQNNNDLSKLKITKLLFFITAVTASNEDEGLLSIFDNFSALPYGPVESDVYNDIAKSNVYKITNGKLTFKENVKLYTPQELVTDEISKDIDNAITNLKSINSNLIKDSAFNLVDLSHQWQSWQTMFSLAKRNGKLSMPIPKSMIMTEPKIFKMRYA